ncbi:hypothetical protein CF335_g2462 [Tilletia laevis]|nr:hypothetical protein CF335_g2462 [Tilletia laevis]
MMNDRIRLWSRTHVVLCLRFAVVEYERVPKDFWIRVKLNSTEFTEASTQPDDIRQLSQKLECIGVNWIELSDGRWVTCDSTMRLDRDEDVEKRESTKKRDAFFLRFAEQVRPSLTKTRVYVTGGFRKAEGMVRTVQDGTEDGIGLDRPAAEEPDLPKQILMAVAGEVARGPQGP